MSEAVYEQMFKPMVRQSENNWVLSWLFTRLN